MPDPGNPQSFNRFSYVLGNPLGFIDPTGFFSPEQIEEYAKNTYGSYWEMYVAAWKEDYFFYQLLLDATYGDTLYAPGSDLAGGTFTENGSTFGFECTACQPGSINRTPTKNLADYQAQPNLFLCDSQGNFKRWLAFPPTIEMGLGLDILLKLSWFAGLNPAQRPIFDYSAGYPAHTGKRWDMTYDEHWRLRLFAGDSAPYLIFGPVGSTIAKRISAFVGKVLLNAAIVVSAVTFVDQAWRTTWEFGWNMVDMPYNNGWQYSWGILQPTVTPTPSFN